MSELISRLISTLIPYIEIVVPILLCAAVSYILLCLLSVVYLFIKASYEYTTQANNTCPVSCKCLSKQGYKASYKACSKVHNKSKKNMEIK